MRIREALPEENARLQSIQAECPMGVDLKVRNVNAPDFFGRSQAYGERKVLVADEGGEILGSGALALKTIRMAGREAKAGYDFQYFTAPAGRRKGVASSLMKWSEAYYRDQGADCAYCMVIAGNRPALEWVRRSGFSPARNLVMAGMPIFKPASPDARSAIRELRPDEYPEAAALIESTWAGHDFHEVCTAETLARFRDEVFSDGRGRFLALAPAGSLLAVAGCWDWSRIMSVTVLSLNAKYGMLRAALSIGRLFRPVPDIPKPGDRLRQWLITHMGFREPGHMGTMLRGLNDQALAAGTGQIFSLFEPSPRMKAVFRGIFRVDTGIHLEAKHFRSPPSGPPAKVHPAGIDL